MQRLCFSIPEDLKKRFERMSKKTNFQQSQQMLMALHALVAYYDDKGSFIFADLINPKLRKNGIEEETKSSSRLSCTVSDDLKNQLDSMSQDVGLHQSQLMIMAIQSLVANYEGNSSLIFADLLNPVHREKRNTR